MQIAASALVGLMEINNQSAIAFDKDA